MPIHRLTRPTSIPGADLVPVVEGVVVVPQDYRLASQRWPEEFPLD